jgi:hypothetical protein
MKKYLLAIVFLALPLVTHGATATLSVDTGFNSINILEGTIKIPEGIEVEDISTGDSMILIWIQEPAVNESTRTISFTGLIPGGFTGSHAVFSFAGDFNKQDLSKFGIIGITALKNDGKGTPAEVKTALAPGDTLSDSLPPVTFRPVFGRSDDLSSGKLFVSFLTQDKGSGIDHYEYASKLFGAPSAEDWSVTASPVFLSRLDGFKKIYVKAVDRAGNEEIVETPGPNRYAGIFVVIILCIIIVVCAPSLRKRFFSS